MKKGKGVVIWTNSVDRLPAEKRLEEWMKGGEEVNFIVTTGKEVRNMKKPLIRNTNLKIWSREFEQVIEDPFVVVNFNPENGVEISFADDSIYVSNKMFVVEIEKVTKA